ncbi:MAG: hypothetical protein PHE59_01880 [Patescibacteria group bacterium]|nr:hypothetical protein [Patescibacteria group bacterium]MDD5164094.1 hypothetical protein [Patescibacteria group bacterium]MDD5534248.1 hypothetical protein [Patescibacteria group bacterium]
MNTILTLLGFTGLVSTIWNILAYFGMAMIIIGVVSAKFRNHFFVWGAIILCLYAWFFLHNSLLVGLEFVVAISGALNLFGVKRGNLFIVGLTTVIVYTILLLTHSINGIWYWVGSFGLLGCGLGLTQMPKKIGFVIMAIGGFLIIVYSGFLSIWIWFVLNIIFFIASLIEIKKFKTVKA